MPEQSQSFINWMKALGMLLIVYGHVVGDAHNLFNAATQPIYTKQLGVAFFVFIMGWSLANEKRPAVQVVFNRLFPIYFYGFLGAIAASVLFYILIGDINESNYLPFMLGINVLLDYFPANPTTWYIGLYLHLVLFWCFFLRKKTITGTHVVLALCLETVCRSTLMALDKNFTAYMVLGNWITVFMLGHWLSNRKDSTEHRTAALAMTCLWLALLCGWAWVMGGSTFLMNKSFPFRAFTTHMPLETLIRSLMISFMYLANTFIFFQVFRRTRANRVVDFFARNTLIIFITHMLVVYSLSGWFYRVVEGPRWFEQMLFIIVLYVGIALCSEIIERCLNVRSLRHRVWQGLASRLTPTIRQRLQIEAATI